MRVKIKFNGETHKYSSSSLSSISFKINTLRKSVESKFAGSCIVDYGSGYTNEFDFSDDNDFLRKYNPCVEQQLLKEIRKG